MAATTLAAAWMALTRLVTAARLACHASQLAYSSKAGYINHLSVVVCGLIYT